MFTTIFLLTYVTSISNSVRSNWAWFSLPSLILLFTNITIIHPVAPKISVILVNCSSLPKQAPRLLATYLLSTLHCYHSNQGTIIFSLGCFKSFLTGLLISTLASLSIHFSTATRTSIQRYKSIFCLLKFCNGSFHCSHDGDQSLLWPRWSCNMWPFLIFPVLMLHPPHTLHSHHTS